LSVFGVLGYVLMWWTRKNLSLNKQLGEEQLGIWEKICEGTKLGTEPAINFVSSCLITNDRVFIIIRIIMAFYSMTLTILGFAGIRSIIFGSYFPLATVITIYVSRHRHLIVEGFGGKMQVVNKLVSYLFALQVEIFLLIRIMFVGSSSNPARRCMVDKMVGDKPIQRSAKTFADVKSVALAAGVSSMCFLAH
jgi:hypothetical protein